MSIQPGLQIKPNTMYRLHNGWKIGPLSLNPDGMWSEKAATGLLVQWLDDGTAMDDFDDGRTAAPAPASPIYNIVAEWPTQPNIEADAVAALEAAIGVAEAKLDETAPDIKETIADEAKRIVAGARRGAYGKPEQNFERIARFWQAYFENTGRPEAKITAADVSPMLRLMKEARLCETPDHYDSHVDLVGYALTGAEVNKVKKPS